MGFLQPMRDQLSLGYNSKLLLSSEVGEEKKKRGTSTYAGQACRRNGRLA
jgi:hypothetical protein